MVFCKLHYQTFKMKPLLAFYNLSLAHNYIVKFGLTELHKYGLDTSILDRLTKSEEELKVQDLRVSENKMHFASLPTLLWRHCIIMICYCDVLATLLVLCV